MKVVAVCRVGVCSMSCKQQQRSVHRRWWVREGSSCLVSCGPCPSARLRRATPLRLAVAFASARGCWRSRRLLAHVDHAGGAQGRVHHVVVLWPAEEEDVWFLSVSGVLYVGVRRETWPKGRQDGFVPDEYNNTSPTPTSDMPRHPCALC